MQNVILIFGAFGEAVLEQVDRFLRAFGFERDEGQIAALLEARGLERGEPLLHSPRGLPVLVFGVQHFQIVEHPNHDRSRVSRFETRLEFRLRHVGDFVQEPQTLVAIQQPTGSGGDRRITINGYDSGLADDSVFANWVVRLPDTGWYDVDLPIGPKVTGVLGSITYLADSTHSAGDPASTH